MSNYEKQRELQMKENTAQLKALGLIPPITKRRRPIQTQRRKKSFEKRKEFVSGMPIQYQPR